MSQGWEYVKGTQNLTKRTPNLVLKQYEQHNSEAGQGQGTSIRINFPAYD